MLADVEDVAWTSLLDPERIDASKQASETHFKSSSSDELALLRAKSKHDLFFLTRGILGYDKLSPNIHRHLCSWVNLTNDVQFRLILMPRGHFKTTLMTICDGIRIALPDDSGDLAYPLNLGPEVRILIGHEIQSSASRFLFEITGHFTNNPVLMGLFPECVPNPRKQRMNKEMLELPRKSVWQEPTFDTMGVGAKSQGRHYNYVKLDDIFGDKARDSKIENDRTKQWIDNIQAFLTEPGRDKIDWQGTRYSLDDVYGHIIDIYGKQLYKYIRRIEEYQGEVGEEGKPKLTPIFPERFPPSALEILRKNPIVWAAQYVNDPIGGLSKFDVNLLRHYKWLGEDKRRLVVLIPDSEYDVYDVGDIVKVRDLDIILLVDPSAGGKPGIVVTGTDHKRRVFVLEAIKREMPPSELVDTIFKLVRQWGPRIVGIEKFTFGRVYEGWITSEKRVRGVSFKVEPLERITDQTKSDHIMGLEQYLSAGQIYVDVQDEILHKEVKEFGATDDIHCLDALAYGPKRWRVPNSPEVWNAWKEKEKLILQGIDPETGYSLIA